MAYNFAPLSFAVAGTGSSANLVASSAGQSISIWQLAIAGTTNDTITATWTAAGTATSAKFDILANTTAVIPYTGAAWAAADVGTAISFTAASTTKVTSFYTKGTGG